MPTVGVDVELLKFPYSAGGNVNWYSDFEKNNLIQQVIWCVLSKPIDCFHCFDFQLFDLWMMSSCKWLLWATRFTPAGIPEKWVFNPFTVYTLNTHSLDSVSSQYSLLSS